MRDSILFRTSAVVVVVAALLHDGANGWAGFLAAILLVIQAVEWLCKIAILLLREEIHVMQTELEEQLRAALRNAPPYNTFVN